jgi:hypothetical protein
VETFAYKIVPAVANFLGVSQIVVYVLIIVLVVILIDTCVR